MHTYIPTYIASYLDTEICQRAIHTTKINEYHKRLKNNYINANSHTYFVRSTRFQWSLLLLIYVNINQWICIFV